MIEKSKDIDIELHHGSGLCKQNTDAELYHGLFGDCTKCLNFDQ